MGLQRAGAGIQLSTVFKLMPNNQRQPAHNRFQQPGGRGAQEAGGSAIRN